MMSCHAHSQTPNPLLSGPWQIWSVLSKHGAGAKAAAEVFDCLAAGAAGCTIHQLRNRDAGSFADRGHLPHSPSHSRLPPSQSSGQPQWCLRWPTYCTLMTLLSELQSEAWPSLRPVIGCVHHKGLCCRAHLHAALVCVASCGNRGWAFTSYPTLNAGCQAKLPENLLSPYTHCSSV